MGGEAAGPGVGGPEKRGAPKRRLARRLAACGEILGWKRIPCVILKLESVLAGEYAENEFRKQFTPSERAAIGAAIEKEWVKKERKPGPKSSANADDPIERSIDLAAKRAGFKSAESFERAKTVTESGAPETIRAMDQGDLSISAAAAIASQPKDKQRQGFSGSGARSSATRPRTPPWAK